MSICKECKNEIEELHYVQRAYRYGSFNKDADSDYEFNEWEQEIDEDFKTKFKCPDCRAILFTDEDEARNFLEGKDV